MQHKKPITYTLVSQICTEHKPQLTWWRRLWMFLFALGTPVQYSYTLNLEVSDEVRIGSMVMLEGVEMQYGFIVLTTKKEEGRFALSCRNTTVLDEPMPMVPKSGILVVFAYAFSEL